MSKKIPLCPYSPIMLCITNKTCLTCETYGEWLNESEENENASIQNN